MANSEASRALKAKPRLLILSASTGNGHISAAKALLDMALEMGLDAETYDALDFTPRAFRAWFRGGYEGLVRFNPGLWGHLYRTSDKKLFNFYVQTALDWWACGGLEEKIESFSPDWVVCTHSVVQPRLVQFRKRFGFRTAIVLTDIYPHLMWLRGDPDWYFVPTERSQDFLESRLPSMVGHVEVSGMPIHKAFALVGATRKPHGGRLRVLVTAGGIGGGPVLQVVQNLASLNVDITCVAGRNADAEAQLKVAAAKYTNLVVHGHVPLTEMAELMAQSDVLVAKSGGLTTFEALASGCAFVVYRPFLIPGQEEGNADYLEQIGAGVSAVGLEDLHSTISRMSQNPELVAQMQAASLSHGKPEACRFIIDHLIAMSKINPAKPPR